MINLPEESINAEDIVGEKGHLHDLIFKTLDSVRRVSAGLKPVQVNSGSIEQYEKMSIRERNRTFLRLIRYLHSITNAYHNNNDEYWELYKKIGYEMSTVRVYLDRGSGQSVEMSMNDYDPDGFYDLIMLWHDLLCMIPIRLCGYFEAGRTGYKMDNIGEPNPDEIQQELKRITLRVTRKRYGTRGMNLRLVKQYNTMDQV